MSYAAGEAFTPVHIANSLLTSIGGGVAAGAVVAALALLLASRTTDRLVEVTITAVAAYGSFLAAERLHASGVLASLTSGIILGNVRTRRAVSRKGRTALFASWEFAAFGVNSLIFLLIGVQVAHEHIAGMLRPAAIAVSLVLLSRAASIYPLAALLARSELRISLPHQHIMFWGGLRGALALALALPESLPGREAVVTVTFAVTAFSIVAQGLTIPPLLRRLGEYSARGAES